MKQYAFNISELVRQLSHNPDDEDVISRLVEFVDLRHMAPEELDELSYLILKLLDSGIADDLDILGLMVAIYSSNDFLHRDQNLWPLIKLLREESDSAEYILNILGFSGDQQFMSIISDFLDHPTLKTAAAEALQEIQFSMGD